MKTEKFEEFVTAICKPRSVEPTQKEWAVMHQLRQLHIPFAIVIGRKGEAIDIRQCPIDPLLHMYARLLHGQMLKGNLVLYVCYQRNCYVRLLSPDTWTADYRAIVPERLRPREVLRGSYRRKKASKATVYVPAQHVKRDSEKWTPTDEDITFGNPYKKKCPNHGFQRTHRANEVMSWLGALGVYA